MGAGLEEEGTSRRRAVLSAKLRSDGSPRRGKRANGQSRGTVRAAPSEQSPVAIPSERAMNRVLLSKGL